MRPITSINAHTHTSTHEIKTSSVEKFNSNKYIAHTNVYSQIVS